MNDVNKCTCEFVICRLEVFESTLKVKLELRVIEFDFVELKDLKLDLSVGSAKVSISFMNF